MKTLTLIFAILATTLITAQESAYWIGGTPGQETNWETARNWSTNQVPDAFTHVIIQRRNSGHFAQPVISSTVEVLSIDIHSGATLTVSTEGEIMIDGSYAHHDGINVYNGEIVNNGVVSLVDFENDWALNMKSTFSGNGRWLVNDEVVTSTMVACGQ